MNPSMANTFSDKTPDSDFNNQSAVDNTMGNTPSPSDLSLSRLDMGAFLRGEVDPDQGSRETRAP